MPNLPKWPTETEGLEDQVQVLGRKCAHRERLREMAEQHNQELAEIQTHNHLLEQQREGKRSSNTKRYGGRNLLYRFSCRKVKLASVISSM